MKLMNALLAATLMLVAWGCSRGPEPHPSVDADVAAQNRINGFMYVAVVPKLQSCWSRVQGKGEIVFKYTYRRSGTNWVWNRQEVESSTLQKDQEPSALQCMGEAARDSSFPMEAAEAARKGDEFVIHWTWPVPFPADVTALGRMIDTGGGRECTKSCVSCNCKFTPGPGTSCSCDSSCSGYTPPCTLDADGKGCSMKFPACATGRMGGFGGVVIARAQ
jgi:hypothetical protein